jgi:cell wall-associated NlpC family hydrolase
MNAIHRPVRLIALAAAVVFAVSCSSHRASEPYRYTFVDGKTARLVGNHAEPPRSAPLEVRRALAAGNELSGKPYRRGGGHRRLRDSGYDCSGAVSYVLNRAGLLRGSMPSQGFRRYGRAGEGRWITLYAKNGHVFLVIAGLRFDTGGSHGHTGPRWKPWTRQTRGFHMRHPAGL